MALLTVDDLARDLKVKNEDLLRELATLGYQVEGPDSHLETDDPGELRAKLVTVLPQREIVEKRIKPTVIRRRMKKKPPAARQEARADVDLQPESTRMGKEKPVSESLPAPEKVEAEKTEVPRKPKKKVKRVEPARIIEMAPKPPVVEAPPTPSEAPPPEQAEAPVHAESPEQAEAPGVAMVAPEVVEGEKPAPNREGTAVQEQPVGEAEAPAVPVEPQSPEEAPAQPVAEAAPTEEKPAKKKKKKERKMQPAQIIGKVELKKEVPKEPEPPRIVRPGPEFVPPEEPVKMPLHAVVPEPIKEDDKRKKKKKDRKGKDVPEEVTDDSKLKVRRRKEVILGTDLYEDRQRGGRLRGRGKKTKQRKTAITTPKASKRRLKLPELVSVAGLAHKMSVKAAEVIRYLLTMGVTASMNEGVDFETASIVASEFGFEAESTEQVERALLPINPLEEAERLVSRPPVITVMGHVDHGKTSLLDAIRSTHVTDQEAGGITQHIGAYKVRLDRGELVFLDTPGHEAFTAMRARGANVTDFVVLVVAADDGVMEQTREAINHARAAKVPIIVAVNKIDKVDADRDRVMRELSEHDLIPETWGGDTLYCFVSAKTNEGLDEFLELILLQAEMMELKANPQKKAVGTVIEARLDKGKGPVATVLVTDGTLSLGDPFVAGTHYGKIRAMLDHEGKSVSSAGPATPVEIQGFSGVPEAGEPFIVVDEEKIAKQIGVHRAQKQREHEAAVSTPASVEDLLARMQEQEAKELNLIIKADVQGSAEALKEALLGIPSHDIKVKIIHSGVGSVTESDVMLASASRAMLIGFNVRPTLKSAQLAEQQKVDLRLYTVIYEAIEGVRMAMTGLLEPVEKETVMGRAEVRQTFNVPKVGVVAGCHVTSGKIERSNQVRLVRDGVVVYEGKIVSMKRFKDDVKEVQEGYECGISLENYRDIKVGDEIEAFIIEQESAELT